MLFKRIAKDKDMCNAVNECCKLLKHVFDVLVVDDFERM